jgi:hypothetical protein
MNPNPASESMRLKRAYGFDGETGNGTSHLDGISMECRWNVEEMYLLTIFALWIGPPTGASSMCEQGRFGMHSKRQISPERSVLVLAHNLLWERRKCHSKQSIGPTLQWQWPQSEQAAPALLQLAKQHYHGTEGK